jgi:hypothetical protein
MHSAYFHSLKNPSISTDKARELPLVFCIFNRKPLESLLAGQDISERMAEAQRSGYDAISILHIIVIVVVIIIVIGTAHVLLSGIGPEFQSEMARKCMRPFQQNIAQYVERNHHINQKQNESICPCLLFASSIEN